MSELNQRYIELNALAYETRQKLDNLDKDIIALKAAIQHETNLENKKKEEARQAEKVLADISKQTKEEDISLENQEDK